jgi:hypothetical protein
VIALIAPTIRAVPWAPVALALTTGLLVLSANLAAMNADGAHATAEEFLLWVRATMLCGALSVAFMLDDPAASMTESAPVPVWFRRVVRIALVLPAVAVWWGAVLVACAELAPEVPLPAAALTLELAALAMTALALSAVCARWVPEGLGGAAAAPGRLLAFVVVASLPDSVALLTFPETPEWRASRYRWVAVLVIATAGLAAGSGDPARAWLRGLRRRSA